jgi:hypothetical protein
MLHLCSYRKRHCRLIWLLLSIRKPRAVRSRVTVSATLVRDWVERERELLPPPHIIVLGRPTTSSNRPRAEKLNFGYRNGCQKVPEGSSLWLVSAIVHSSPVNRCRYDLTHNILRHCPRRGRLWFSRVPRGGSTPQFPFRRRSSLEHQFRTRWYFSILHHFPLCLLPT